jgi:protein-L-isoaspartate(D-aspartate) O-methyltransferase
MKRDHLGIGMTSQRTRDRLIQRLHDQGIENSKVLDVMRDTPRHIFVDEALASRSYEDTALPIGHGQTISQPYIVARMTEALINTGLNTGPLSKVLEIGTGSGYQAAILARLVDEVYSTERIHPLFNLARRRLQELHLFNIHCHHSDGTWGWKEHAPYDGILVTAAPLEIPNALLEQLSVGGSLVVPIGQKGQQQLILMTRTADGYERKVLNQVSFVPMLSGVE